MLSPFLIATATRSHRCRTRCEVGRNRRSKSRPLSTVPTIESSWIDFTPSLLSPVRPNASSTSSKGRIRSMSSGSRLSLVARRRMTCRRRAREKSDCASCVLNPVSPAMESAYPHGQQL